MSSVPDREVVDLLRDDPDLLAIADAVVATQRVDARQSGGAWRVLVAAAVVVVAAAIAVVAPWHGHGDGLIDHALAAVGHGPVLHAVIESDFPNEWVVNLSTGAERPVRQRLEYWYDADRRSLRAVTRVNGRVMDDGLVPPSRPAGSGEPRLDPALTAFLSGYRDALKSGQARRAGRGVFEGRSVIWLRFDYRLFGERVGVDANTYRPVVIEPLNADGTPASQIWKVAAIDSRAFRSRDFRPARPARPSATSMHGGGFRMIAPFRAARILRWTPVWLDTSFGSLPLRYAQLEDVIHDRPASGTTHGVLLAYGRGTNQIRLAEAKTVEATFWLFGLGVPAPGTALLLRSVVVGPGPIERTCQALVRSSGVWVQVEGWNQASSRCVDAARALVRIEP